MVTNLVILQNRVLSGFSTFTVYYTLQWQFSNMQNAGKNSYFEPWRSSRNSLAQIATLHPPLTCIWYDSISYQGPFFGKSNSYIYPLPSSAQFMVVCLFISRIYLGFTAALTASNWIKPLPKYYFVSNCCMNKVLIENITQIPSRKIPDLEILQKCRYPVWAVVGQIWRLARGVSGNKLSRFHWDANWRIGKWTWVSAHSANSRNKLIRK